MIGMGLYLRLGLFAVVFLAGMGLMHRITSGQVEKARQEAADLRAANETFAKQQAELEAKGRADKEAQDKADGVIGKLAYGLAQREQNRNNAPIKGDCDTQIKMVIDRFAQVNSAHPRSAP